MVLLVALLTISTAAFGQVPPPPANLTIGPSPSTHGAFLQWQPSLGAVGYKVYRAVDNSTQFDRIATVQSTSYIDWMVYSGHVYRYYVKAYNQAGESGPSNIVTFTLQLPLPATGAIIGTVTDDSTGLPLGGVSVKFYRNNATNYRWATTDSLGHYSAVLDTGRYLVFASKPSYIGEWYDDSPNPQGATPIYVGVGTTTTANFGLSRMGPPPPPHVQGTIVGLVTDDSTGLPIGGVRIRFYRPSGTYFSREARTDSLGMYQALLDTGRYLVYASRFGYKPEYYDNSPTPQGATPVPVYQNAASTANFGLAPIPTPIPPRLVNVSGNVTDTATGLPIGGAVVAILRTFRNFSSIQGFNGMPWGFTNEIINLPGFGTMHGVVAWVRTDPNGHYTGRVPAGFTYIVFSFAPGYLPEWFNDKRSPMEADRLLLLNDTTGIDFTLTLNPTVQNSIAGSVDDSAGARVPSHVMLYKGTALGPRLYLHTISDSLGNYVFRFLRNELFYIKAVPIAGYAPAWYKAGEFGVTDWHNADTVRALGAVTDINIGVVPVTEGGVASIGGRVLYNTNAIAEGATVYAINLSSNRIAGFGITEELGTFGITDLEPGSYRLIVDKEGFTGASSWTFNVTAANNYQVANTELRITPSAPTLVRIDPTQVPARFELDQNYPNPFNPSTEISFSIPTASNVQLAVYSLLGQEIVTLVNTELGAGVYSTRWDGTDNAGRSVSSGMFFYKIVASPIEPDGSAFVQIRKMLLLK
jgi:hypothetical protein